MRERTLRISSAGKTFSCTGWKIGWATGPAPLVSAVARVKQFLTFVNAGRCSRPSRWRWACRTPTSTGFRAGCRPAATAWSAG
jgi:N-succinyldiaminopimelate aminotransferase